MNESELVEGAEYQGQEAGINRPLVRGVLRGVDADNVGVIWVFLYGADGNKYTVYRDTLRRVSPAAPLYIPKPGERVRIAAVDANTSYCLLAVGQEVEVLRASVSSLKGGGWIALFPKTNLAAEQQGGCTCRVSPVVEPAKVAEGGRLFEGDDWCSFCGKTPREGYLGKRVTGPFTGKYRFCLNERATPECVPVDNNYEKLDREYEWRLAANAQKLSGSARNARHCDKCMDPAVEGATLCAGHGRLLGKPVEHCGCGAVASYPHPNMDGDCPMEFCLACREKEERRLAEGPTADDLAWALRRETLAAEEAERKRYLDRCAAYQDGRAESDANGFKLHATSVATVQARQAAWLDAAIARVKPKEEESDYGHPAHWPSGSGEDYEL